MKRLVFGDQDKPITVAEMIEALKQFPAEAWAYAYEGEITGVIVVARDGKGRRQELGEIYTTESLPQ